MQAPQNRPSDIGSQDNSGMARDVGVRLRHARKLRGMTQQELAKSSGVKQASISEVETGESKSPVGTNLVKLAQSLQVSPEWLASGKGPMEQLDQLPPEALSVARDWMRLAPEVRSSVRDMIRKMVETSDADRRAVPDETVERAYGKPGKPVGQTDKRR
jgi:transcriptional regulator with XRE-family HTH domain